MAEHGDEPDGNAEGSRAAGCAVLVLDGNGCISEADAKTGRLLGCGQEELRGRQLQSFLDGTEEVGELLREAGRLGCMERAVTIDGGEGRGRACRLHLMALPGGIHTAGHLEEMGEWSTRAETDLQTRRALERAQVLARLGSWTFDYRSGTVEASPVARAIYGLGDRKWTIEEVRQIPLPECREELDRKLRPCFEEGAIFEHEFPIQRPSDGAIRYVHSVAEYDAERQELNGSIQDITERREAEQVQTALSSFLDNSSDIIVVKDRHRRVIATNKAFVHATGRNSIEEMIGKTDAELFGVSEETEPIHSYMLDDLATLELAPGQVIVREEPVVFPDGTRKTFLTRKFPVQGLNGEVEAIGIISADISEQKQTEAALRQREAQYRSLAEDLPLMMSSFTANHQWTYVNPAFAEFHNYRREELKGANLLDYLDDQQEQTHLGGIARIEPDKPVVVREMVYPNHRDGRKIVRWFYRGIFDRHNRLMEYRAIGEDITRYKELEQHLIHAREEAKRASEAKSDFLASMSHEIRTPLNGVIGMADFLRSMDLPQDLEANISVIYQAGFHLLDLINDILDFSKIEAGRLVMQFEEANLPDTVEELCMLMRQRTEAKHIELTLRQDLRCSVYVVDVIRLRQVLVNLIGNAIKFTPEGGRIEVEITDREPGWLDVAVRDNGCGIEPEKQTKLFEPFVQADGSINKKFGGTGLGLSICKRIVEKMGGSITVESVVGEGSCFRFRIRSDRGIGEEPQCLGQRGPEPMEAPIRRGLRALIVDDEPNNSLVVSKLLQTCGLSADEAPEVETALQRLQENRYHLILIDLNIPGRSGLELAEMIRSGSVNGTRRDQYMVAYTASSTERIRESCEQTGFNDFLPKPVSLITVRKMLETYERSGHAASHGSGA